MNKIIDLYKPIPREWRIRGADSHVYRIGLSLFKPIYCHKRHKFYNPLLILTIIIWRLLACSICVYLYFKSARPLPVLHLVLADLDYFISSCYAQDMLTNVT